MARRIEAQRRAGGGGMAGGMLPLVGAAIVALLIGLGLGYSLGLNAPIAGANPNELFPTGQQMWVEMTADALALTGDQDLARLRMSVFTPEEQASLLGERVQAATNAGNDTLAIRLQQLATTIGVTPGVPGVEPGAETPTAPEGGNTFSSVLTFCGISLLIILLLGAAAVGYTRMKQQPGTKKAAGATRRGAAPSTRQSATKGAPPARAEPAQKALPSAPEGGGAAVADDEVDLALDQLFADTADDGGGEDAVRELDFAEAPAAPVRYSPALDEFMTRYSYGDDNYDMSFAIETPQTEFLGECGVGVGESLNQGAPQQVTAFEVWLFDKDDIRTVTKVLLSDYAWNNDDLRSKLAPKGELIHVQPGDTLDLETKSLRVRARIREVEYGAGGPGDNSFFDHLVVELTPQQKL